MICIIFYITASPREVNDEKNKSLIKYKKLNTSLVLYETEKNIIL
jgi:hypothetical protein